MSRTCKSGCPPCGIDRHTLINAIEQGAQSCGCDSETRPIVGG